VGKTLSVLCCCGCDPLLLVTEAATLEFAAHFGRKVFLLVEGILVMTSGIAVLSAVAGDFRALRHVIRSQRRPADRWRANVALLFWL